MLKPFLLLILFSTINTHSQDTLPASVPVNVQNYMLQNPDSDLPSKSTGTVSEGTLENGKRVPFAGKNFTYFDTASYLHERAYVHSNVLKTMLDVYDQFSILNPEAHFRVMECSNKEGGKIYPHHTHQNGLSVDFMTPLLLNGEPYYGLDTLGAAHYWLDFDDAGNYSADKRISIHFNLVARHILLLDQTARKYGLKIAKVIFKLELKEELFSTEFGKTLAESSVYFAKNLPELINSLHDDHYHVDFAFI